MASIIPGFEYDIFINASIDLSKEDDGTGSYLAASSKAKIEFWLGHVDEGFRWLEEAYKQKEREVLTIQFNPQFDMIRNHPRFKEFIKQVPFPPND